MLCAQGLHLSVPEIDFLINFYDNDGKGALNYDELVEALKGELTERRCVSPPAAAACLCCRMSADSPDLVLLHVLRQNLSLT